MKTVLAFETSCSVLSVAVGTRQGKILEARRTGSLRHSENLIPLIDQLLHRTRLTLDQVEAFAIDRGPGSFTGLRIGFGFLKGFLAVRKKPCYGAISLDMMAYTLRLPEGTRLGILMDARREAVYSRFYRRLAGIWKAEGKLQIFPLQDLKNRIKAETVLAGDTKLQCGKTIHGVAFPRARTLVQWFQAGDPRLSRLQAPREGMPLYLRASEAEENRRRKPKNHAR